MPPGRLERTVELLNMTNAEIAEVKRIIEREPYSANMMQLTLKLAFLITLKELILGDLQNPAMQNHFRE